MIRVGQVIGVLPEKADLYKALHADDYEGVRAILKQFHFQNSSIFSTSMDDGNEYLFGYYEYTGDDFEADNARLMAVPAYAQWLCKTDACQKPLKGCDSWKPMERVFYLA